MITLSSTEEIRVALVKPAFATLGSIPSQFVMPENRIFMKQKRAVRITKKAI
jgi:hypothetical protein